MIQDFNGLPTHSLFEADICLIGSGVAGLFIAHRFIDRGFTVLVIEAGGKISTAESQAFYHATIIGNPYKGHLEGRYRVFGGTSTRWGGQLLPLENTDFLQQDHIAHSGWPIRYQTLLPYYKKAELIMQVNQLPYDATFSSHLNLSAMTFNPHYFEYKYSKWTQFQHRNLAGTLGIACIQAKNITLLLNATVTSIQLEKNAATVKQLTLTSSSGHQAIVKAKNYVLCAGTLETTRLLLAATDVCPAGIGNDYDQVGRFFQDHISFKAAEIMPRDNVIFSRAFAPCFIKKIMHFPRLQFTQRALKQFNCLGVFGHVQFEAPENNCFAIVRDILRRKQEKNKLTVQWREIKKIIASIPYFTQLSYSYFLGGKIPYPPHCRWYLQVDVEQAPAANSRVYLSNERDSLNMPRLCIDWQIGERERSSAAHFIQEFKREWQQGNMGTANWNDAIQHPDNRWLNDARDAYHQAGTTRMSVDPAMGVVNPDLKIHGIDNLYIASCSVFPTSGSANPTFTLMALSLRLADHLVEKLR